MDDPCPLCFENEFPKRSFCKDAFHAPICKLCIQSYCIHKIENSFIGTCPTMICPCQNEHKNKQVRLLDFQEWSASDIVSSEDVRKYRQLASSLLSFLCAGCHTLRSLSIGTVSTKEYSTSYETILGYLKESNYSMFSTTDTPISESLMNSLIQNISSYCSGEISVDIFYNEIFTKYFPKSAQLSDRAVWNLFKNVLVLIPEPERQACLHLRYLRWRPRIWTPCCHREHCFRCRTRDFHEGKTCTENTETLDHSVVDCPGCGLNLCKGDGCNTITCPCGKQFSWTAEKEIIERLLMFARQYPNDTSACCALVLVGECPPPAAITVVESHCMSDSSDVSNETVYNTGYHLASATAAEATPSGSPHNPSNSAEARHSALMDAKAWQQRHPVEVSRALLKWWSNKYAACSSQVCAKLLSSPSAFTLLPEGIREVVELWRSNHANEVRTCQENTVNAVKSIFKTFYPHEKDRATAAVLLLRFGVSAFTDTYSTYAPAATASVTANANTTGAGARNMTGVSGGRYGSVTAQSRAAESTHNGYSSDAYNVTGYHTHYVPNNAYNNTPPPTAAATVDITRIPLDPLSLLPTATLSSLLTESARLWMIENEEKFQLAYEEIEHRMTDQFLILYGHTIPTSTALLKSPTPSPTGWNIENSNSSLTFSNNKLTVKRVGNISSYPAVFADLPMKCDRSRMRVRLDNCPRGPNWLTIGLTRKHQMPAASSDGCGRTSNTWGIHDDRSTTHGMARVSANGQDVAMCRKFQQGDIVTVTVDVAEGWLEIAINEHDYKYRFTIPAGSAADYSFAMTFANDHSATLLVDDLVDTSTDTAAAAAAAATANNCTNDYGDVDTTATATTTTIGAGESININSGASITNTTTGNSNANAADSTSTGSRGSMGAVTSTNSSMTLSSSMLQLPPSLRPDSTSNHRYRQLQQQEEPNNSSQPLPLSPLPPSSVTRTHTQSPPNSSTSSNSNSSSSNMSDDQLRMLLSLKQNLRKIDTNSSQVSVNRVCMLAQRWVAENRFSTQLCIQRIVENRYAIECVIGKSHGYFTELVSLQQEREQTTCAMDISDSNSHSQNNILNSSSNNSSSNSIISSDMDCEENSYNTPTITASTTDTVNTATVTTSTKTTPATVTPSVSTSKADSFHPSDPPLKCTLTWNSLVSAVCWARLQRDAYESKRCYELAIEFVTQHGDSAPFLAAAAVDALAAVDTSDTGHGMQSSGYIRYVPGSGTSRSSGSSHGYSSDSISGYINNNGDSITCGSDNMRTTYSSNSNSYSSNSSRHYQSLTNSGQLSTNASAAAGVESESVSAVDRAYEERVRAREAAVAFMSVFPDVMNEWYDYNATLEEPMFGLAQTATDCRCLPRHMKHCPCPQPPATATSSGSTSGSTGSGGSHSAPLRDKFSGSVSQHGDHMKLP